MQQERNCDEDQTVDPEILYDELLRVMKTKWGCLLGRASAVVAEPQTAAPTNPTPAKGVPVGLSGDLKVNQSVNR